METETKPTEETQAETPETPEQEQPVAEETPPEAAEAKDETAEDTEEPGEEEPGGEEEPAKPAEKHKRAGGWMRQVERLKRELAEARALQQPKLPQSEQEKTPDQKAADYIDGIVEKRLAAREAQRQQETAHAEFQRRQTAARAVHPDYDEVLLASDAPVSAAVEEALLTSEHGPAIMYQLAKRPDELARISALPPLAAAREIGRLEAQASSTAAPKASKSAVRPPAPPTSVNGKSSSTRNLDDLPIAEYKRAMRSGRR